MSHPFRTKMENTVTQRSLVLLRRLNVVLIVSAIISIPAILVLKSYFYLFVLSLLACLSISIYKTLTGKVALGIFSMSILMSILVVLVIALFGFYGHNTKVVPFDDGGSWVSSKSWDTAIEGSLLRPDVFTAALFGRDCNDAYGPNCSGALDVLSSGLDVVLLAGGIVIGNVLVRRNLHKVSEFSTEANKIS
jgi:hypothetical protein